MSKNATVISFGGIKGGPGKTTLAVNTAIYLYKSGKSVLLIDADHQRSASDFTEMRSSTLEGRTGYLFFQLIGQTLYDQVIAAREKYDYIVIDCHGGDNAEHRLALLASDIVMIPIKPRALDFWPITMVDHMIKQVRATNPGREIHFLSFLNQADLSSDENRETARNLSNIESIEFLPEKITNRKAFARSAARGLGIMEYMQDKDNSVYVDPIAVDEFRALIIAALSKTQTAVING